MSSNVSNAFKDVWEDWCKLRTLRAENLTRLSCIAQPNHLESKYRLLFVRFLKTVEDANQKFEEGKCIDDVVNRYRHALRLIAKMMDMVDKPRIFNFHWHAIFVTVQVQAVMVCCARGDIWKAEELFHRFGLSKKVSMVTPHLKKMIESLEKVIWVRHTSPWYKFHHFLTERLRFATKLPVGGPMAPAERIKRVLQPENDVAGPRKRQRLDSVDMVQETNENAVAEPTVESARNLDTIALTKFWESYVVQPHRLPSGYIGQGFPDAEPRTFEDMLECAKKMHARLLLLGVNGPNTDRLVGKVLSVMCKRFTGST